MSKIEVFCEACGKSLLRYKYQILKRVYCSRACAKGYLSEKMSQMNIDLNPSRMTLATRVKLSEAHKREDAVSYPKILGRHTHRVVAEEMLGRALEPGEVVHHIDGDKRNCEPSNLRVFSSQAEHAKWHKEQEQGGG